MRNKININGFDFRKTQIGSKEHKVSVFQNDKLQFQFNVSLQPTGKEDVLPTYQLTDKSMTIPDWTKKEMNNISDWIIKNEV
jgi:hypothetical protein